MTTSSTAVLSVSRDDVIKAALRSLKVIGVGETPGTEDYTNCAFALNLILKALAADGYLTWLYQTISIPLTATTASYTIAESGGTVTNYRPVRIASASLRDNATTPNDTGLTQISRQEYEQLTPKAQPGVPTQFYYDPQLTAGIIYFWPIPATSSIYTARLLVQRPVQDIAAGTSSTQTFDLPQEWYQPLRWILADEIAPEYEVDLPTINMIRGRAFEARNKMADFSREEASVFFQPDAQSTAGIFR